MGIGEQCCWEPAGTSCTSIWIGSTDASPSVGRDNWNGWGRRVSMGTTWLGRY